MKLMKISKKTKQAVAITIASIMVILPFLSLFGL